MLGVYGGGVSQRAAVERSIAIAAASVSEVAPASAVGIAVHEPRMVPVVMEMLVGIAHWTDGNQDESEHDDQNGDLQAAHGQSVPETIQVLKAQWSGGWNVVILASGSHLKVVDVNGRKLVHQDNSQVSDVSDLVQK